MTKSKSILIQSTRLASVLALSLVATPLWAQDAPPPDTEKLPDAPPGEAQPDSDRDGDADNEAIRNDGDLPAATSDDDAQPEVAGPPSMAPGGVVRQAGVGGTVGYGRVGVLELGGSAGLTLANNLSQMTLAPSIGWFLSDNFEITVIADLTRVATDDQATLIVTGLIEPSYHVPFNRTVFGFLGIGFGASYIDDLGAGFAMAPRIGANFLVGRSGILTPSASWQYTTHDISSEMGAPTSVVAVSSALRLSVGYTVMW